MQTQRNDVIPILALPVLVSRAASQLASASSAAEVLEARDMASVAYDAAKKAYRLAKAKRAHDEIVLKAAQAQVDAIEIECMAKRRLADEYDAAQARGEVASQGKPSKAEGLATTADIGLTHKDIHDARKIRDAEAADPGVVRRALDALLASGSEPTRAALKRDITPLAPKPKPKPLVSNEALWLWGRLRDFERLGYFDADPAELLAGMTPPMRADVGDVIGPVLDFLNRISREVRDDHS